MTGRSRFRGMMLLWIIASSASFLHIEGYTGITSSVSRTAARLPWRQGGFAGPSSPSRQIDLLPRIHLRTTLRAETSSHGSLDPPYVTAASSSSPVPTSTSLTNGDSMLPIAEIATSTPINGEIPSPLGASLSSSVSGTKPTSSPSPISLEVKEVDMLYERRTSLKYDATLDRYVRQSANRQRGDAASNGGTGQVPILSAVLNFIGPRLSVALVPAGVTPNYYRFMRWRLLQRFVSANLSVFGTQSLLMALGIKSRSSQMAALSAALNWVLKDALGKIVRMIWASKMGRRFDSDAKRWRYRSSFVYAVGNGLEIVTYIFPKLFLVFATLANCCKQISMLTSSSTRTALYNSFRDGTRENIGDITAKGEAQIAIVDLLGIACGVTISKMIGTSVQAVLTAYFTLQALEIACMYQELRSVVYRVLNFERMVKVISDFVRSIGTCDVDEVHEMVQQGGCGIQTPAEMAATERIFRPPTYLARRARAFGSLGRTKLSPTELERLQSIFRKERFLLVVGTNLKNPRNWSPPWRTRSLDLRLRECCHIVLHAEASNVDIVKSTLALILLRQGMADSTYDPDTARSSDCYPLIEAALKDADRLFPIFLRQLSKQGWESPARSMFGRVHMRAEWPLLRKPNATAVSAE